MKPFTNQQIKYLVKVDDLLRTKDKVQQYQLVDKQYPVKVIRSWIDTLLIQDAYSQTDIPYLNALADIYKQLKYELKSKQ